MYLKPATVADGDQLIDGDQAANLLAHGDLGVPVIVNWEGDVANADAMGGDPAAYLAKSAAAREDLIDGLKRAKLAGYIWKPGTRDLCELPAVYWHGPAATNPALHFAVGAYVTETPVLFSFRSLTAYTSPPAEPLKAKRGGGPKPKYDPVQLAAAFMREAEFNTFEELKTLASWKQFALAWMTDHYGAEPARSTVEDLVTPLYRAWYDQRSRDKRFTD